MRSKLWTKNFCLVTLATTLGSVGSIAGGFALSFLVFDETGSTLAAALIIAIQMAPSLLIPLAVAPWMDRLPRKAFLVGGDICNGLFYASMGLWLLYFPFSYTGYLGISLLLACLNSVDELAYTSIYPELLPKGLEEKGYAVSSMLYPVLRVLLLPLAAVLLDTLGAARILLIQSALSFAAALTESGIRLDEHRQKPSERYSFRAWRADILEAVRYLKRERGLRGIYEYMAFTNGVGNGYSPILIAFFRTTPGLNAAMYSFFSVVEFAGRSLGSLLQYRVKIPPKKKFTVTFLIYHLYELMDLCLLWLPYPLMLVNRGICGFLGSNSAILRSASVQRYIPERLRSRVNAFDTMLMTAAGSILALAVGAAGEFLDYRLCITFCAAAAFLACRIFIGCRRNDIRRIYEAEPDDGTGER